MRPELRPKKLTRRSASPSEKVFRMMASVSLAGMKCRRADAAPDHPLRYVRFARTRGIDLITTHPSLAQCLHPSSEIFSCGLLSHRTYVHFLGVILVHASLAKRVHFARGFLVARFC